MSKSILTIKERKIMMEIFIHIWCAKYPGLTYEHFCKFAGYLANKGNSDEGRQIFENTKNAERY